MGMRGSSLRGSILKSLRPMASWIFAAGSLILLWEASGRILEIRPEVLPTPARIAMEISSQAARLYAHTWISAAEITGGFLLALMVAIPLAVLLVMTPHGYRVSFPVMQALRQAPMILLVPVIFIWFGFGMKPEILIAFALSFMTIMIGIVSGLQSVPVPVEEILKMMGATDFQIMLKARVPASLPGVLSALKAAVPLCVVGVTAGEFAQAETGLGSLMLAAAFKRDTPMVFAAFTLLGLIGLSLYAIIAFLEHLLADWAGTKQPAPR
jgi:NitT/TauT family transport system permease protein